MSTYSATYIAVHNGGIHGSRALLTHEPVLARGAAVLSESEGSPTERRRLAIEATFEMFLLPKPRLEYGRELQQCIVRELKEIAATHRVELFGARRKDEIIRHLEFVRNLRNRST